LPLNFICRLTLQMRAGRSGRTEQSRHDAAPACHSQRAQAERSAHSVAPLVTNRPTPSHDAKLRRNVAAMRRCQPRGGEDWLRNCKCRFSYQNGVAAGRIFCTAVLTMERGGTYKSRTGAPLLGAMARLRRSSLIFGDKGLRPRSGAGKTSTALQWFEGWDCYCPGLFDK